MRDKSSLEMQMKNLLFPHMTRILQSAADERLNTTYNIVKPGLLTFARIFAEVGRLPYTSSEEKAAVSEALRRDKELSVGAAVTHLRPWDRLQR